MNASWSFFDASPALLLMFDSAVRAAVVLLCAAALSLLLRRASAALRHGVWTCAVIGALLMPFLAVLLPGWSVLPHDWRVARADAPQAPAPTPPLAAPRATIFPPSPPLATSGLPSRDGAPLVDITAASAPLSSSSPAPRAAWKLLAAAWAIGSAITLLPLLVGSLSIIRLRRGARRVDDSLMHHLARTLGLNPKRIDLLVGPSGCMPMTWLSPAGRHRLLLPADHNWPPPRLRAVLLHELAHIKRRDCLTQWLASLCCAMYWFNPLCWLAARRMKIERERACDDMVLATGSPADDYADDLLHIATGPRACRHAVFSNMAGIAMARKSTLEGRLLAILDPKRSRRALSRALATLLLIVTAAVVIPAAMLRAADAEEQEPAIPSPALQDVVQRPRVFLLAHAPDQSEASLACWQANGVTAASSELADHVLGRTLMKLLIQTPGEDHGRSPIVLICENTADTQDIPFAELMIRDPDDHDTFIGPGSAKVTTAQWMGFLIEPPPDANVVDMRLRYSDSTWEQIMPIEIEPIGGTRLADGVFLGGMGNNSEGEAFVSIVIDNAISEANQFAVAAFDANDTPLAGWLNGTVRRERDVHIYTFTYRVPWSEIARLELRRRPIREVEFRNVSLKPGQRTDLQVAPIEVLAPQDAEEPAMPPSALQDVVADNSVVRRTAEIPRSEPVTLAPVTGVPLIASNVTLNFADPTARDGSFHGAQRIAFVVGLWASEGLSPGMQVDVISVGQRPWALIHLDGNLSIEDSDTGKTYLAAPLDSDHKIVDQIVELPAGFGSQDDVCPVHLKMRYIDDGEINGSYWYCAYLSGNLPLGAGGCAFEIVNLDQQMEFRVVGDGTDKRDAVLGIDLNHDGRIDSAAEGGETFNLYEPFTVAGEGRTYRVTEVDPYTPRVVFQEVDDQ